MEYLGAALDGDDAFMSNPVDFVEGIGTHRSIHCACIVCCTKVRVAAYTVYMMFVALFAAHGFMSNHVGFWKELVRVAAAYTVHKFFFARKCRLSCHLVFDLFEPLVCFRAIFYACFRAILCLICLISSRSLVCWASRRWL